MLMFLFDLKSGFRPFGEVSEPTEYNLYFVVFVEDMRDHRNMVMLHYHAYKKEILNNMTLFYLSNFYKCPDPSYTLAIFSIQTYATYHMVSCAKLPSSRQDKVAFYMWYNSL
ncbi:hypothetical protein NPIL_378491 [Nephila pilipes]|uniref:Uncharacterized protein n=1 Tax=Nephila pilipes TaxID=299642 RepID=A0A8X6NI07_NEPPI|nr:hypothetical protein NPIL_378491 [Nephila pilipes]